MNGDFDPTCYKSPTGEPKHMESKIGENHGRLIENGGTKKVTLW